MSSNQYRFGDSEWGSSSGTGGNDGGNCIGFQNSSFQGGLRNNRSSNGGSFTKFQNSPFQGEFGGNRTSLFPSPSTSSSQAPNPFAQQRARSSPFASRQEGNLTKTLSITSTGTSPIPSRTSVSSAPSFFAAGLREAAPGQAHPPSGFQGYSPPTSFVWPIQPAPPAVFHARPQPKFDWPNSDTRYEATDVPKATASSGTPDTICTLRIPEKIQDQMKAMSWSLPLDEKKLESLARLGLAMDEASRELQKTDEITPETASCLSITFSESYDIYRFINDQWLAINGTPHPASMYNLSCLLSLMVELQLRFLVAKGALLETVQKHEMSSVAVLSEIVSPNKMTTGLCKIASTEPNVGKMIHKQLRAAKACLGTAVAAGWSDLAHLQSDRDLKALRELLP